MILMHTAAPYFVDRLLAYVETKAKSGDTSPELARYSAFIPALRHVITIIHRCHLAAFYLHGVFYHISKRISGTRYVSWKLLVSWWTSGFHVLTLWQFRLCCLCVFAVWTVLLWLVMLCALCFYVFFSVLVNSVDSTSAVDCWDRLMSKITSRDTLNFAHSTFSLRIPL